MRKTILTYAIQLRSLVGCMVTGLRAPHSPTNIGIIRCVIATATMATGITRDTGPALGPRSRSPLTDCEEGRNGAFSWPCLLSPIMPASREHHLAIEDY
jgi:hypothetical protein